MLTRIRYDKREDGSYETNSVIGNGSIYYAVIEPSVLEYTMWKVEGINVHHRVSHGCATTMQSLKKKVKNELKALGVQFSDEVRKKRS